MKEKKRKEKNTDTITSVAELERGVIYSRFSELNETDSEAAPYVSTKCLLDCLAASESSSPMVESGGTAADKFCNFLKQSI